MTTIIIRRAVVLMASAMVCLFSFGQPNVGIGTKTPEKTAALDVHSTTQGLLLPRLTTIQRDAIADPALGLTIYNLDDNCIESWNGTDWIGNCGVAKSVFAISNCSSVTLGTAPAFKQGLALNPTGNALTLTLNVTKSGTYSIQAGPTSQNGYFFNASGTFSSKGTVVLTIPGIGTPNNPTTSTVLDTVIIVMNGDTAACRIPVAVAPSAIPPAFSLTCSGVTASGTATPGAALNPSTNTVQVTISGAGAIGSTYNLGTNTVDGFSFGPSTGVVTSSPQTITLAGTGTPVSGGVQAFTINSNGTGSPSSCSVNYTVTYPKMNIVTFSSNWYGVDLNSYLSKTFVTATANFGSLPTSTVPSQGFNINATGNVVAGSIASYLSSNFPDIIVVGYYTYINAADQTAINNYLNNKGVVLYFSETSGGAGVQADINAFLGYPANTLSGGYGQTTSEPLLAVPGDPVLNGPFGDLSQGNKYWGNDAAGGVYVTGLPASDAAIYSQYGGGASMFRSKLKNFIFVGDGGFIAGNTSDTQLSGLPFTLTGTAPAGKTYTAPSGSGTVTVDNAKLFGNMLAWAIQQAMQNGHH